MSTLEVSPGTAQEGHPVLGDIIRQVLVGFASWHSGSNEQVGGCPTWRCLTITECGSLRFPEGPASVYMLFLRCHPTRIWQA
jgi:hypothetical protein